MVRIVLNSPVNWCLNRISGGAARKEKMIECLEDRIDTLERQVHLNEQIREKRGKS